MIDFLKAVLADPAPLPNHPPASAAPHRRKAFLAAVERRVGRPALIAEIKHATPTVSSFAGDNMPVEERARRYMDAGADALSVVVEPRFFRGQYGDIVIASESAPVLAKGFFTTPEEIECVSAFGASAVLLLAALESECDLDALRNRAAELGLAVLLEIHSAAELPIAHRIRPDLIGINRRNLKNLNVDPTVEKRVLPLLPVGSRVVVESGVNGPISALPPEVDAALVGGFLMESENIEERVRRLIGPRSGKTILKFCGMRTVENVKSAAAAGVTHVGLNLIPRSRRRISADRAIEILNAVDRARLGLKTVAVVDTTVGESDVRRIAGLVDVIQWHETDSPARRGDGALRRLKATAREIWLAISSPSQIPGSPIDGLTTLIVDGREGGSGEVHRGVPGPFRRHWGGNLVRAGGLTSQNVGRLSAGWDGADVATGIEKDRAADPAEMNAFADRFFKERTEC